MVMGIVDDACLVMRNLPLIKEIAEKHSFSKLPVGENISLKEIQITSNI